MGVAEREDNLLALHVRLVADTDHVHLFGETFGHTQDGVVREGPSQSMQGGVFVRSTFSAQLFALNLEVDTLRDRSFQRTFRPLHFEFALANRNANALWQSDDLFSYKRHN